MSVDFQSLDALYEDVWQRWEALCDDLPTIEFPIEGNANIVYSRYSAPTYELQDYASGAFRLQYKPTKTLDKSDPNRNIGYTYLLGENGLPVLSQFGHVGEHPISLGRFIYSQSEVVYYEIHQSLSIPMRFDRITLENGHVAHFQHIFTWVGLAFCPPKESGRKLRRRIKENMTTRDVWIREFDLDENGRAIRGRSLWEHQSWKRVYYSFNYTYDAHGTATDDFNPRKPDRVIRFEKPGAKKNEDPLIATLATKIADKVIDTLRAERYSDPLQLVMLSYSATENYIPGVTAATTADAIPNLMLLLGTLSRDRCILLDEKDFKPEYKKLMSKMQKADDYSEGMKMLRQAARSVTERASKELNVTPDFVAFAVDWEQDGDDVEGVLLECGANQAKIEFFQEKGWI